MGNFLWPKHKAKVEVENKIISTKTILINQASCYKCNNTVRDEGKCVCGNVEINSFGHRVKEPEYYSNSSLVEYK
jgi:hypothetical protein